MKTIDNFINERLNLSSIDERLRLNADSKVKKKETIFTAQDHGQYDDVFFKFVYKSNVIRERYKDLKQSQKIEQSLDKIYTLIQDIIDSFLVTFYKYSFQLIEGILKDHCEIRIWNDHNVYIGAIIIDCTDKYNFHFSFTDGNNYTQLFNKIKKYVQRHK